MSDEEFLAALESCSLCERDFGPVSYTHLDVYKRQTQALALHCLAPAQLSPKPAPLKVALLGPGAHTLWLIVTRSLSAKAVACSCPLQRMRRSWRNSALARIPVSPDRAPMSKARTVNGPPATIFSAGSRFELDHCPESVR